MKYTKDDILKFLISQYNLAAEFDPVVIKGYKLTYELTIFDWRDICDFVYPRKLAVIYHKEFNIKRPISELEEILINENHNTLGDFCEYISKYAKRISIKPIKILGKDCRTASIFKILKQKLAEKEIDTTNLRPSSDINSSFLQYGNILVSEVNLIAPGTISNFECKPNKLSRYGRYLALISFFIIITTWIMWGFHGLLLLPLILSILIVRIGDKRKPEKLNVNGFKDFRDLIYEMDNQLKNQHITSAIQNVAKG